MLNLLILLGSIISVCSSNSGNIKSSSRIEVRRARLPPLVLVLMSWLAYEHLFLPKVPGIGKTASKADMDPKRMSTVQDLPEFHVQVWNTTTGAFISVQDTWTIDTAIRVGLTHQPWRSKSACRRDEKYEKAPYCLRYSSGKSCYLYVFQGRGPLSS